MKKYLLSLVSILLLAFSFSCSNSTLKADIDPFDYEGNFEISELTIDGKMDEEEWTTSEYVTPEYTFGYKSKIDNETYNYSLRVYRGERELYVFYAVEDRNLLSYGEDNGTNVSYSDSCELYINTEFDDAVMPQTDDYQINMGIHNRTRVAVGNGSGWSTSSGIIQYEVVLDGTLNDENDVDKGYTLEMCIPYKQIGIDRNKEFGITFGVVDRYLSSGSMASKMWYGVNISGHFGSPQNPSAYFTLKKNTIEIPPVDEYILSEDNTNYIENHSLTIASGTLNDQTHDSIKLDVSRKENIITILGSTENKWKEHTGLFLLFDFGDYTRGSRDENTYCLRVYPGSRSIKDFYKYPNIGVAQTCLTIQMDDNHVYVSLDIDKLLTGFVGNVNFAAASIENQNQVIVSQLNADGRLVDQTNVSSFVQITADNTIVEYIDPYKYDSSNDKTNYIDNLTISTSRVTNESDTFSKIDYKLNREENTISILCESEDNWHINELLMLCFDLGSNDRTAYDSETLILRFYPLTGSIKDFYSYPNTGLNLSNVTIYKNSKQAKVIVDLNEAITSNSNYVEDGIKLGIAVAHKNQAKVLEFATFNNLTQTSNLTTWPSIKNDNTISEVFDPNHYYKDNTIYNTDKSIVIPPSSNGSENFESMNVSVNRNGYKVTILLGNQNQAFSDNQMVLIQYDLGLKNRTVRDENTFILRCYPSTGEIKDFFRYPGNKYSNNFIYIKTSERFIQITIDFSIISQDVTDYIDEGIGLSIANCDKASSSVLKYWSIDGVVTDTTNPSNWLRLNKNGQFVE